MLFSRLDKGNYMSTAPGEWTRTGFYEDLLALLILIPIKVYVLHLYTYTSTSRPTYNKIKSPISDSTLPFLIPKLVQCLMNLEYEAQG